MSALKQIQIRYEAIEDRLLLRVSTQGDQEFRFWLTRRYCSLLLTVLRKHQALDPEITAHITQDAQRAVRQFKEEAASANTDFCDDFTESTQRPLGDEPVLAFQLSYRNDNGQLHLTFAPRKGAGIAFALDQQFSHNLSSMLTKAIQAADWHLLPPEHPATQPRIIN